jgi:alkaline phosphatase D
MVAPPRVRFRRLRSPGLSRRQLLKSLGLGSLALVAAPLLPACGSRSESAGASVNPGPSTPGGAVLPPASAAFLHGVASGDPLTDRVILWSRVTADAETVGAGRALAVDWLVSLATDLSAPVQSGRFLTDAARDYTVKVDPAGLASYTTYYYQFSVTQADGTVVKSPIGRTKTAPKAGEADRLRFVSASCQNYTFGYFNSHGAIALKPDIDAMLFLGDYIYETGGSSSEFRAHDPAHEILTLADYRQRHAQYKTDPDLQACHRQHPFICVWDDHETTDNSYSTGANNHTEGAEGVWKNREGWAIRAYFEWMPVRDNPDMSFDSPNGEGLLPEGHGSIQRRLAYGDLVDLIMLDTRLAGRVVQDGTALVTEEHTILGKPQREWFLQQLSASRARWKIVGQQVNFAPLKVLPLPEAQGGTYLNEDAWDGYRFDRNAVMQHLKSNAISDVVFLSGDIHSVIAMDLPIEPSDPSQYNPITGAGSLAVEFCCNGVANVGVIGEPFMVNNPHMKYANLLERGYLLLDVTAERVQGEYFFTGLPQVRSAVETFQRALFSNAGDNHLTIGTVASSPRGDASPLAP